MKKFIVRVEKVEVRDFEVTALDYSDAEDEVFIILNDKGTFEFEGDFISSDFDVIEVTEA